MFKAEQMLNDAAKEELEEKSFRNWMARNTPKNITPRSEDDCAEVLGAWSRYEDALQQQLQAVKTGYVTRVVNEEIGKANSTAAWKHDLCLKKYDAAHPEQSRRQGEQVASPQGEGSIDFKQLERDYSSMAPDPPQERDGQIDCKGFERDWKQQITSLHQKDHRALWNAASARGALSTTWEEYSNRVTRMQQNLADRGDREINQCYNRANNLAFSREQDQHNREKEEEQARRPSGGGQQNHGGTPSQLETEGNVKDPDYRDLGQQIDEEMAEKTKGIGEFMDYSGFEDYGGQLDKARSRSVEGYQGEVRENESSIDRDYQGSMEVVNKLKQNREREEASKMEEYAEDQVRKAEIVQRENNRKAAAYQRQQQERRQSAQSYPSMGVGTMTPGDNSVRKKEQRSSGGGRSSSCVGPSPPCGVR